MKMKAVILLMVLLVLAACGAQPTVDIAAQKTAEEAQAKAEAAEATAAAAQAEAVQADAVDEAEAPQEEAAAELSFGTWGDVTFFEDCFNRFQAANPQYADVAWDGWSVNEETDLLNRLMTDWMAKSYDTMPAMSEMSNLHLRQLASNGLLVDLTDQMMPYKGDISPGVWDGITYEGKIYAVPWMANSAMVWYHQDVFDMAGVNPDDIKTWDDYIEAGKTITNFEYPDGKKRYMVDIGASEIDFMTMQLMLGQQDTGIFDRETGELTIDTDPRFARAFETYSRFATEGIALPIDGWDGPWYAAMGDGTIATYISANWWDQVIKGGDLGEGQEGVWRAMMLPAFEEGGNRATLESGSANVVIYNRPGVDADMAWKMAEYCYMNPDVTADLLKSNNLVPAYIPALDDPMFVEPDKFYGGQAVGQLDKSIQEQATVFPFTQYHYEASSYIGEQLMAVMNGEISVEDGIANSAENIRLYVLEE